MKKIGFWDSPVLLKYSSLPVVKSVQTLHRFTNLAAAIHMLRTRTITLLDPNTWDDKNDAYFMAEYKRQKGLPCWRR
jgi:hypothetical protein